jgi:hypothetical protein
VDITPPDGPWTEIPEDLSDSPRAEAFEKFFNWLGENHCATLGLPDAAVPYLILELCSGDTVPESLGGGVGVSVIHDPRAGSYGFHDELRMVVAVGTRAREADIADFYAHLTTVAHEMGHLADFWQAFGVSPAQADRDGDIGRWPQICADCHGPIEDAARELTTLYVDTEDVEWAV